MVTMSPYTLALLSIHGNGSKAQEMRREVVAGIPPEARATVHQDLSDMALRAQNLMALATDCENRCGASLTALDMPPPKTRVKVPYEAQLFTVMAGGPPDLDKEVADQWAELEAACAVDTEQAPVEEADQVDDADVQADPPEEEEEDIDF